MRTPLAALLTPSITSAARCSSPASHARYGSTTSISSAPSSSARSVSTRTACGRSSPDGKFTTVATSTGVPLRASTDWATKSGQTHTAAVPCPAARSHSRSMPAADASSVRSVRSSRAIARRASAISESLIGISSQGQDGRARLGPEHHRRLPEINVLAEQLEHARRWRRLVEQQLRLAVVGVEEGDAVGLPGLGELAFDLDPELGGSLRSAASRGSNPPSSTSPGVSAGALDRRLAEHEVQHGRGARLRLHPVRQRRPRRTAGRRQR